MKPTFALEFQSPKSGRDVFLARFQSFCSEFSSFLGISEGELLAEAAHEKGYETESWVLDAGEAPHERDWLGQESVLTVIAYFSEPGDAQKAKAWLDSETQNQNSKLYEQPDEDWNAQWKAAFTGIQVDENLRVLPPWHEDWLKIEAGGAREGVIGINPGAGFGTGTHETTQLCLQILQQVPNLEGKTVLDFGSGSGILGIAAALRGAQVTCVEVDPMANDNARDNAQLNQVSDRIEFLTEIPERLKSGKVDVLMANILRPILLQYSDTIQSCLHPGSELVLSGLIESDLEEVMQSYGSLSLQRLEKNEWRALWLRRANPLPKC